MYVLNKNKKKGFTKITIASLLIIVGIFIFGDKSFTNTIIGMGVCAIFLIFYFGYVVIQRKKELKELCNDKGFIYSKKPSKEEKKKIDELSFENKNLNIVENKDFIKGTYQNYDFNYVYELNNKFLSAQPQKDNERLMFFIKLKKENNYKIVIRKYEFTRYQLNKEYSELRMKNNLSTNNSEFDKKYNCFARDSHQFNIINSKIIELIQRFDIDAVVLIKNHLIVEFKCRDYTTEFIDINIKNAINIAKEFDKSLEK